MAQTTCQETQVTVEDLAKLQQTNKDAQAARAREFGTAYGEMMRVPDTQKDAGWQTKMTALKTAFRADVDKMVREHRTAEHALVIEAAAEPEAGTKANEPQKPKDDAA